MGGGREASDDLGPWVNRGPSTGSDLPPLYTVLTLFHLGALVGSAEEESLSFVSAKEANGSSSIRGD